MIGQVFSEPGNPSIEISNVATESDKPLTDKKLSTLIIKKTRLVSIGDPIV